MKFRYWMETPDDGAGGGAATEDPPEETPDRPGVFSDPSRWDTPPAEGVDEPAEPVDEPADEPEDTPPAAVRPEGWADEDWAAFQRKYPGGSPADLWKHYSHLQSEYSRIKNGVPPKEEVEEVEETPPSWTAHGFSSLGPIPTDGLSMQQKTELSELMQLDPKAAAHWAVANSEMLTEDEFSAIQNNWALADPWGSRRYWDQAREQVSQERQQAELGPRMDVIDMQRRREGVAMTEQALPDFVAHKAAFAQWLEERPQVDEYLATLTTPEEVSTALTGAFYQFYGPYRMSMDAEAAAKEEQRIAAEEAAAAEAAAAAETANVRARTARTTAPAAPAGSEASADDIRSAIRDARR